jgi:anti-sigma factor RsiW
MSLSPADWELLHREIDGEATEIESAGLRERLAGEPELRAAYQALAGVGRSLSEVGLADPPPGLAPDVMRQVRLGAEPAPRWGWLAPLGAWVARQPALALASSLAVGLLAGLLITSLSERGFGPLDEASVSGTLLPASGPAGLPVVDEARLVGPGIDAKSLMRRGIGVVVAEFEILSGGPVDVSVDVDAGGLQPRGFECVGGQPTGGAVIEAGRLRARQLTAGRCFVSLAVPESRPGPIAIRIRMEAGGERAEAVLRAGADGD